jgi:hypothetical protein
MNGANGCATQVAGCAITIIGLAFLAIAAILVMAGAA